MNNEPTIKTPIEPDQLEPLEGGGFQLGISELDVDPIFPEHAEEEQE